MRDGLGEIHIEYTIEYTIGYADGKPTGVQHGGRNRSFIVVNRHLSRTSIYLMNALVPQDGGIQIVTQKRNEQQSFYELDFRQLDVTGTVWSTIRAWFAGIQFSSLFRLGMRHIAEGTDHLLFLLVLLLPAPLVASSLRWGSPRGVRDSLFRILSIVTAFTLGHSITLSIAAFNAIIIPSRSVEVLIAVSIFVSAVHAARPIFPGKETWIAAFFGLVHGLAFAATLDRLGLRRWDRLAGILAFNLGIETMQMLVVVAILPSLMLLSRTRAYPMLRIGGAVFAGAASIGWILERLFDIPTPVDTIVNAFARHAPLIAVNLLAISLVCRFLLKSRFVSPIVFVPTERR